MVLSLYTARKALEEAEHNQHEAYKAFCEAEGNIKADYDVQQRFLEKVRKTYLTQYENEVENAVLSLYTTWKRENNFK